MRESFAKLNTMIKQTESQKAVVATPVPSTTSILEAYLENDSSTCQEHRDRLVDLQQKMERIKKQQRLAYAAQNTAQDIESTMRKLETELEDRRVTLNSASDSGEHFPDWERAWDAYESKRHELVDQQVVQKLKSLDRGPSDFDEGIKEISTTIEMAKKDLNNCRTSGSVTK